MRFLFSFVAKTLHATAAKLNLTYEEVNVLAYYFLLPWIYALVIDSQWGIHGCKAVAALMTLLLLFPLSRFRSKSARLFQQSARFLDSLKVVGMDYVVASVVVCVFIPLGFLMILICCL